MELERIVAPADFNDEAGGSLLSRGADLAREPSLSRGIAAIYLLVIPTERGSAHRADGQSTIATSAHRDRPECLSDHPTMRARGQRKSAATDLGGKVSVAARFQTKHLSCQP
jgi:hypothetical protein